MSGNNWLVDRIKEADKRFSALSEKEKGSLNAQVSDLSSSKEKSTVETPKPEQK